ncbi:MAG: hypothetical protein H7Y09_13410 [Chitinophagaceae bacterium]|nr:hypothetical protein [Anaerolineae bacterium]
MAFQPQPNQDSTHFPREQKYLKSIKFLVIITFFVLILVGTYDELGFLGGRGAMWPLAQWNMFSEFKSYPMPQTATRYKLFTVNPTGQSHELHPEDIHFYVGAQDGLVQRLIISVLTNQPLSESYAAYLLDEAVEAHGRENVTVLQIWRYTWDIVGMAIDPDTAQTELVKTLVVEEG